MEWRLTDGRLQARIGLVHSPAELFDAAADELRVELTGRGEVVRFSFSEGRATGLTYDGRPFTRDDG